MRICYINPDLGIDRAGTKGAAAHVRGLIAAFESHGHTVDYLSPTAAAAAGEVAAPEPQLFHGLPRAVDKRVARALRHIWANAGVEAALERHCADVAPDLIYERYGPFAVAGALTAARLKIPHVLEVNAPLAREGAMYRNQALGDAAQALELGAFSATGRIVAVSEELKRELVAEGVRAGKIKVVPNGVDTGMFPDGLSPSLPDPRGRLTFGFIGGLRPWHGVADMATAFEQVAEALDARLLVIGDGPERPVLEALSARLPDRVVLTGAVSHDAAPGLLRSVDIALAPYPRIEGFYYSPLKILEYLAAGCAVIASDIGQTPLLLDKGKTGLLTEAGNPGALAEAMARLATDTKLRASLSAKARKAALARHDWRHRAGDILRIADKLGAGA